MILNIIFIIYVIISIYFIHKNKQSIALLKVDNNNKSLEIVRLKKTLSTCEDINVEEQKVRINLNKRYDNLQKDYNKIYYEKTSLETTVDNYAIQVESLNKSIKEKSDLITLYNTNEITLKEDINKLTNKNDELLARIDTLQKGNTTAKVQQGADIIEAVSTKKIIRKRK